MGDERRRRRRASSHSWHMPPSERRELYVAKNLPAAVELITSHAIAGGADSVAGPWREELQVLLQRIMNGSWADGADREADLRSARDAERSLRRRMEQVLRRHGLDVPTDPRPSDPPPD